MNAVAAEAGSATGAIIASAAAGRPMRRDAARNQELILAAAREVIAESGLAASMEAIAARAGVGVGTVYRRFPSKDALVAELVRLILDELILAGRTALERGDGSGLESFLRSLGRSFSEHRRYADKLMDATESACADTLRSLIGELFEQAHQHGVIDADITLGDVLATAWALRGVVQTAGAVAPDAWQRHLDTHLRGLRQAPAPGTAPSITADQLSQIAGHNR
jgi:AcrR family transcriptional regulator